MSKRHYIIPIFVPHKGCPHDCVFCNQKKITGQTDAMTPEKVHRIVETHLENINAAPEDVEIAFFGGSFTGIPMEEQNALLSAVQEYIGKENVNSKKGRVGEIRVSTRPDYINKEILENLKRFHVNTVELGVQSMDEEVLRKSGRGHSSKDVEDAMKCLKQYGFRAGVQMMVGLPGDTYQKSLQTVRSLIAMGPEIARIYPALIIRETAMETMYYQGTYMPLSLRDCIRWCADFLMLFETSGVQVIRIGLQPTDHIALGCDLVTGPFHPAIRQLVESEIWKRILWEQLTQLGSLAKSAEIFVPPSQISNILGQKRENLFDIKRAFSITTLRFRQDASLESDCILIRTKESCRIVSRKEYIARNVNRGIL